MTYIHSVYLKKPYNLFKYCIAIALHPTHDEIPNNKAPTSNVYISHVLTSNL